MSWAGSGGDAGLLARAGAGVAVQGAAGVHHVDEAPVAEAPGAEGETFLVEVVPAAGIEPEAGRERAVGAEQPPREESQ